MEVISLAIAIPPLLTLCLDILDKVQSFRDYDSKSRQLGARFAAAKFRLKDWARNVGIVDGMLGEQHHVKLDQPEVVNVVRTILSCLRETFGNTEKTGRTLNSEQGLVVDVPPGYHTIRRSNVGSVALGKPTPSTKKAVYWALKRKAVFSEDVEMFEMLVERLYDLVDPNSASVELHTNSRQLDIANDLAQTRILDSIENFRQEILLIVKQKHQESRRIIMNSIDDWLHTPAIDQDLEKHIENRLEGTCEWIFDKESYCTWELDRFPDNKAKILWIAGPAGHGKSILCAAVIQHFKDNTAFPIAYFLSSQHVQAGCSPSDIISSWISQLCRTDQIILDLVQSEVYTENAARRGTQSEIWTLFKRIVGQLECCVLILDGYDEFARIEEVRQDFLQRLKKAIAGTKTRVLVTSRPESDIELELSPPDTNHDGISIFHCRIALDDVVDDISLYSRQVVTEQLPKKNEVERRELADQLAQKCEGMFLWIKLQKLQLRDSKGLARLRRTVEGMPDGLTQTYGRNWKEILALPEVDRRRAIDILRWVCFALRPLTIGELCEALIHEYETSETCPDDLPDQVDWEYIDGEIKGLCGSLIEIRKGGDPENLSCFTIHLIHVSAKEFLVTALPPPLPVPKFNATALANANDHIHLAEVCVRYLLCEHTWEQGYLTGMDGPIKGFLSYAATGWLLHRDKAAVNSEELEKLTMALFDPHNENFSKWTNNDEFYQSNWAAPYFEDRLNARLYMAARAELPHVMDHLHSTGQLDFNTTPFTCGTALQVASWSGDAIFERLIAWGADINAQAGKYGSALGSAVAARSIHKVKILLEKGADTTIPDCQDTPILTLACETEKLDIIQLLLEHKASPDHETYYNSPLDIAIQKQNVRAVELLIKHGADLSINSGGYTALHYAAALPSSEIVEILLKNGGDPFRELKYGLQTPLYYAVSAREVENVKLLLQFGAVCDFHNSEQTPVNQAVYSGSVELLKLLVDAGASLEIEWYHGTTPLWAAIDQVNLPMADFIIRSRPSLMGKVYFGRTLLEWIEFLFPAHEKLDEWRSRMNMRVRHLDRAWWLKRQIHDVSLALLQIQPKSPAAGFNMIGRCLKYLTDTSRQTFAFQQAIDSVDMEGRGIFFIRCNGCWLPVSGIRHVCQECPSVDVCDNCFGQLDTIIALKRCWQHHFVRVTAQGRQPLLRESDILNDLKVRRWLQENLVLFKVDDPSPPLVSVEANLAGRSSGLE